MNFYNAKISKAGNHVNLTFIDGQGEQRKFCHCSIRIGEGKTCCQVKENNHRKYAIIEFPLNAYQAKEEEKKEPMIEFDLPF